MDYSDVTADGPADQSIHCINCGQDIGAGEDHMCVDCSAFIAPSTCTDNSGQCNRCVNREAQRV